MIFITLSALSLTDKFVLKSMVYVCRKLSANSDPDRVSSSVKRCPVHLQDLWMMRTLLER